MYKTYITTLTNVRKHPNADRLLLADVFGNTVCVSTDYAEGEIGVYFPEGGQVSIEFGEKNNLLRKKDDAGNNVGGYMDPSTRKVTAIRLRGEKSDGLFLPLSCLEYTGVDMDTLNVGDVIEGTVNGHEICCKYIPRSNTRRGNVSTGNKTRKHTAPTAPLFAEHADTEQLAYNLGAFKAGDEIEISLKMHGTSGRTAYLPVLKGYKRTLLDRLLRREGKPIYDWGYVSGTRRVVLENYEGGFYGDNKFREQHSKVFEGKLWKGETVYYEIVGFTDSGAPIMASAPNAKVGKEFAKQYGKETVFSYGCHPDGLTTVKYHCTDGPQSAYGGRDNEIIRFSTLPQSDIYVYRMTMTNEDGEVVEYTPDFMRYRCEQMGVKTVPVFDKFTIPCQEDLEDFEEIATPGTSSGYLAGDWVMDFAERYYDGPDPIGKTHVREGVVVRIINRPKFCAYKHKNYDFKVLSGIAVAQLEESGAAEGMSEDVLAEM